MHLRDDFLTPVLTGLMVGVAIKLRKWVNRRVFNRVLEEESIQMMNRLFYLSISLSLVVAAQSVAWNGNNWAMACDFRGNDLGSAQVSGERCTETCRNTPGCTHFTWTNYNGGTCWMKRGSVSKDQAVATTDYNMVCGVLYDQPTQPSNAK